MLVGVHSNIQNRIANNPINNSKPFYRSNTKSITDSFQKQNVSFKGKKLSSGEYTDEEIKLMKSTLKSSDETWKDDLYKKQYNHLLANRGKWENVGRYGRGTFDPNSPFERVVCGIFTFGATELGVQIENIGLRKDAKNYVNRMDILRADLQNMKLKEDVAETHKAEKSAEHKVEYLKEGYSLINFDKWGISGGSLKKVVLPKKLKKIDAYALGLDAGLGASEKVYFTGAKPPKVKKKKGYKNVSLPAHVYVSSDSFASYKKWLNKWVKKRDRKYTILYKY